MPKMISFVIFSLSFLACQRSELQTVRVPKEMESESAMERPLETAPPPMAPTGSSMPEGLPEGHPDISGLPPGHPEIGTGEMSMANAAAQGIRPSVPTAGPVTWSTPKGWQEKPGSGFRYATFVIPGEGGLTGDLSVTMLEGDAGGLLSNVNRWRGQIGLAPLSSEALAKTAKNIRPAGRPMTVVNFASETNLIDGRYKRRLLSAVYTAGGKTWFFKLTGEDRLVQSAENDFLKLLDSLKGL